ncbi:hypothetical protein KIPE111705_00440 [Kibdelosporangium persicum]|uniref:Uncharacterized protein n=1 Tax=Kibdelosporangium persicum TaxID=2698649 RepID=A0ABX2F9P2_9PSEU|nr:hypothetical protein [Kibdelosporangium persicum]NRN67640.1 hypothetical protein [Kibdelosporangium persicum]
MPNLDFYATGEDWSAVLEAVFELGSFRVFEAYSAPDHELREFHAATEIPEGRAGRHLQLLVIGAGPDPVAKRIDVLPGTLGDATFRYCCEGWGLVQLQHGVPDGTRELRWSHTNHNTEKRARAWSGTLSRLGDPAEWDWRAITSASGRLNRAVRRMAVSKIGSHPVLPHAARFIADAGLRYEYGRGIHATRAFGATPR